jgi:hypothetical protein
MQIEKCFRPKELAEMTGWSDDTIRRIFKDVKGVIRRGHYETRFGRAYWSLVIPQSVAEETLKKMSVN